MRMSTWRRTVTSAVWIGGMLLILAAPTWVQAQTQLFPLAPIQRERVPCPLEDPVYGVYRHQYFGYFPTCWRSFPAGWGCPSPKAPNVAKAFADLPRDKPPANVGDMDRGEEPGMEGAPPQGPPGMGGPRGRDLTPPLPEGRSPFELDKPGANPNPGELPAPSPDQPRSAARRNRSSSPPVTSVAGDMTAAKPDSVQESLMPLPGPIEADATASVLAPTAVNRAPMNMSPVNPVGNGVGAGQPLPDPAFPPASIESSDATMAPGPQFAPQRRGPLGTLFNGLTSRLRR